MQHDFYYLQEKEAFLFLRVPKALYENKQYSSLSGDCILLYSLMLDRVSLSRQNGWIDKQGRIYIYIPIKEIMSTFHCAREKATKLLSKLCDFGLVEKKRQGLGKPNILYPKKFDNG